jgi:NAD(P)H-hydrate epimerase
VSAAHWHDDASWRTLAARYLSVAQIRDVDRIAIERFGIDSLVLMENAALHCANWFEQRFRIPPRVLILCGRGNNGGDGWALLRHLQAAGWPCEAIGWGPVAKFSRDARANWRIVTDNPAAAHGSHTASATTACLHPGTASFADGSITLVEDADVSSSAFVADKIRSAEVIIDAMLGTGAQGAPREPLRSWIALANAAHGWRVAIDIPTGLDAETGAAASPTFQAAHTLTFVAHKRGFRTATAQAVLGEVSVLPIGIPRALIAELLAAP